MIPWGWLIATFLSGFYFAFVVYGLLAARGRDSRCEECDEAHRLIGAGLMGYRRSHPAYDMKGNPYTHDPNLCDLAEEHDVDGELCPECGECGVPGNETGTYLNCPKCGYGWKKPTVIDLGNGEEPSPAQVLQDTADAMACALSRLANEVQAQGWADLEASIGVEPHG
jgi:hypothetical protein